MKVKLTYNLPDDDTAYYQAVRAAYLASALWDISQYLRKVDRYETGDDIDKIRETFYDILTQYDINLDSLIE